MDTDDDDDSYDPPARNIILKKQTNFYLGSVQMKYCGTCKLLRPPRCSHCSVCDRCIDVCLNFLQDKKFIIYSF